MEFEDLNKITEDLKNALKVLNKNISNLKSNLNDEDKKKFSKWYDELAEATKNKDFEKIEKLKKQIGND